jgi:hypothetical protein
MLFERICSDEVLVIALPHKHIVATIGLIVRRYHAPE